MLATVACSLGAAALMWPVLPDPADRVYGLSSDPLSEVWRLQQFRAEEIELVGDRTSELANVPSGVDVRRPLDATQSVYDVVAATLAELMQPVLAYNLLVFLGLATTGLATYSVVRALGAGVLGASAAAALFVLAPVHMLEAQLHVLLSFTAPLPLLFLLGVRVLERPSVRLGIAFGVALGACGYLAAYLLLEAATLGLGLGAAALLLALRGAGSIELARAAAAALLSALAVVTPLLAILLVFKGEIDVAATRSAAEAVTYSLEASDYVAHGTWSYVGLVGTALAVAALFMPSVPRTVRLTAPLVAAAAFAVSLRGDTSLAGIDLPMPSELIHAAVPYWRVFGRVAIVVSLAVAVLAAFTLDRLARRRPLGPALAVALAVLAAADVVRRPPPVEADLGRADPVAAVLRFGEGPIAEYPLFGFDNDLIGPYLFRQVRHGRPLLNGAIAGTESGDLSAAAGDVNGPQARAALALAGVRELVINSTAPEPSGRAFSLVGRFDGEAVYRVRRPPERVAIAAVRGAYPSERGPDGSSFAWIGSAARLAVVSETRGSVEVVFDAVSHGVPRAVRIGSELRFVGVAPTPVRICIDVGSEGRADVAVEATPAAARLPGGDARVASIGVYHLAARPGCRRP